jgi:hypothetical protein
MCSMSMTSSNCIAYYNNIIVFPHYYYYYIIGIVGIFEGLM